MLKKNSKVIKRAIKKRGKIKWVRPLSLSNKYTIIKAPAKTPRLLLFEIKETREKKKVKRRAKKIGKIVNCNPPTGGENLNSGGKFNIK